ncbi:MAG TPA: 2Fe-2S iron-sulfur cluster-binding protein [Bryobacteraceae bacterium]|nr:2Fe-2S iron-sulfur cluster-binding protein [Bryobacteraceae bacterium]
MPKVTFLPSNVTVEYEPGRMAYLGHGRRGSLLDIAMNSGVPVEHSCGGNCACTTCHVIVRQGDANLSQMEDDEADRLGMASGVTLHSRLACQAVVQGDVTVEVPWD